MRNWFALHRQAFSLTLSKILRTPFSSLFNILVIGIALSLPAGIYALLQNVQSFSAHANGEPQLSLFMKADAGKTDLDLISGKLQQHPGLRSYSLVPREQAMQEMKKNSGIGDVLDSLKTNPLPDAFIIRPRSSAPDDLEAVRSEMSTWPKVAHVQLDSAWAKRLDALMKLGDLAILLLAVLLSFALVAVTFNTIRLQVLTQREEIEVAKLIGATQSFIRRPFLYYGTLQGLAGGIAAWIIIIAVIHLLNGRIAALMALYGLPFELQHLGLADSLSLLLFSCFLGWIGAWLSSTRQLSKIEPR